MKLYTEEQLREAIKLTRKEIKVPYEVNGTTLMDYCYYSDDEVMEQLTPIEVPTTEEIHKMATNYSNLYYEYRAGAEWVVEQLKQEKQ